MRRRGWVPAVILAVCLAAMTCQKLPQERLPEGRVDPAKFADTIPLEYGNLIAATTNSLDPHWVTLWFEKPDKSIVIVGVDQRTWRVWTEPRVLGRR